MLFRHSQYPLVGSAPFGTQYFFQSLGAAQPVYVSAADISSPSQCVLDPNFSPGAVLPFYTAGSPPADAYSQYTLVQGASAVSCCQNIPSCFSERESSVVVKTPVSLYSTGASPVNQVNRWEFSVIYDTNSESNIACAANNFTNPPGGVIVSNQRCYHCFERASSCQPGWPGAVSNTVASFPWCSSTSLPLGANNNFTIVIPGSIDPSNGTNVGGGDLSTFYITFCYNPMSTAYARLRTRVAASANAGNVPTPTPAATTGGTTAVVPTPTVGPSTGVVVTTGVASPTPSATFSPVPVPGGVTPCQLPQDFVTPLQGTTARRFYPDTSSSGNNDFSVSIKCFASSVSPANNIGLNAGDYNNGFNIPDPTVAGSAGLSPAGARTITFVVPGGRQAYVDVSGINCAGSACAIPFSCYTTCTNLGTTSNTTSSVSTTGTGSATGGSTSGATSGASSGSSAGTGFTSQSSFFPSGQIPGASTGFNVYTSGKPISGPLPLAVLVLQLTLCTQARWVPQLT